MISCAALCKTQEAPPSGNRSVEREFSPFADPQLRWLFRTILLKVSRVENDTENKESLTARVLAAGCETVSEGFSTKRMGECAAGRLQMTRIDHNEIAQQAAELQHFE